MPKQRSAPPGQVPPIYILGMMFYGMEYPFGWFGSAVLALLPPSFLHTCLLAEHRKLKNPWLKISATQQQLKHQRVINIILTLNSKHSTVPATKKKINSIPAKTRTREKLKKQRKRTRTDTQKEYLKRQKISKK